jgi:hypothetical protein
MHGGVEIDFEQLLTGLLVVLVVILILWIVYNWMNNKGLCGNSSSAASSTAVAASAPATPAASSSFWPFKHKSKFWAGYNPIPIPADQAKWLATRTNDYQLGMVPASPPPPPPSQFGGKREKMFDNVNQIYPLENGQVPIGYLGNDVTPDQVSHFDSPRVVSATSTNTGRHESAYNGLNYKQYLEQVGLDPSVKINHEEYVAEAGPYATNPSKWTEKEFQDIVPRVGLRLVDYNVPISDNARQVSDGGDLTDLQPYRRYAV